jgi:hypothetical protein
VVNKKHTNVDPVAGWQHYVQVDYTANIWSFLLYPSSRQNDYPMIPADTGPQTSGNGAVPCTQSTGTGLLRPLILEDGDSKDLQKVGNTIYSYPELSPRNKIHINSELMWKPEIFLKSGGRLLNFILTNNL